MASSFVIANPGHAEHWTRLGYVYLALTTTCAIAAGAIGALWLRRFRSGPSSDATGMRPGPA